MVRKTDQWLLEVGCDSKTKKKKMNDFLYGDRCVLNPNFGDGRINLYI